MKKSIIIALSFLLGFCISSAFAVEVTLYGPKQFIRAEGKPYVFTDAFPGRIGQGMILVKNGTLGGTNRVSSAIIKVNGQEVCGTNDFNLEVYNLEIPVNLEENNTISVELRSEVGSYLYIEVIQEIEAEGVAVVDTAGGSIEVPDETSSLFGYRITIPPNALDEAIVISIEYEPGINVPINPLIEEGISLPCFRIIPDDLVLNEAAIISVPYTDDNDDGIYDGTDLPIKAMKLFVTMDGEGEIYRVDAVIDNVSDCLVASTRHFSTWIPWLGRWKIGSQIKYYVESIPSNEFYSPMDFKTEIHPALQQWSDAIDNVITFVEVANRGDSDLVIREKNLCEFFYLFGIFCDRAALTSKPITGLTKCIVSFNIGQSSEANQPLWFTGPYGEYPPILGNNYDYLPFLRIALHEFGHVMGLPEYTKDWEPCNSRQNLEYAIMYYDCGDPLPYLVSLAQFDKTEVRELYGLGSQPIPQPHEIGACDTPGWANKLTVDGNYVYLADGFGSGVHVIDVSNPTNPHIVGSCPLWQGAEMIAKEGNYVYTGNAQGNEFYVIDVSNPTNPHLVGTCDLLGGSPMGIALKDNYAFVECYFWEGINVVDISNPTNPILVGSCSTPENLRNIALYNNYAYVYGYCGAATYVFNISNPANPFIVGSWDPLFNYPIFYGSYAIVSNPWDSPAGLIILNVSNPLNPSPMGQCYFQGGVYDVVGNYAYAGGISEFSIIDISDPMNPFIANSGSYEKECWDLEVEGNYAYIANGYDGITIIALK